MKRILGLDLGTTSIGWALVDEAECPEERSSIIRLGVRVNPLTTDESQNYEKGKPIETNTARRDNRSARRNLQRYKLRRSALISLLKEHGFITDDTILSEQGNASTFETYRLRAKAVTEEISLEQFARVLLMINKKRGYKSSRKAKGEEDGKLINGMDVAKRLYDEDITPGQLCLELLESGKKALPDFYRSDLENEFDRIWSCQTLFYPDMLTDALREELYGKNTTQTNAIIGKYFQWVEVERIWNELEARNEDKEVLHQYKGEARTTKGIEQKKENYLWRAKALSEKLHPEKLAVVIKEINKELNSASGYLGAISDRSKHLFFNHLTVGQALMQTLRENPNASLKNKVYYRQDYLDEFEILWENQAKYHLELTPELKQEIRDVVIFYQRRLKSQKSLISICEFERKEQVVEIDGKKKTILTGSRVIPRTSPLFQEFKIWQTLNNLEIRLSDTKGKKKKKVLNEPTLFDAIFTPKEELEFNGRRELTIEEKQLLAEELSVRESMTKAQVLKTLFGTSTGMDLNYEKVSGHETGAALYKAFSAMLDLSGHEPIDFTCSASEIKQQVRTVFAALGWNTDVLDIEMDISEGSRLHLQPFYNLWHLLYSFEGDSSRTGDKNLLEKISAILNCDKDYAQLLANVSLASDYGNLSAKAIKKILPYMKEGNRYDEACGLAGYRHSASSLTKEEIEAKELLDKLEILPKNSLRNPVVEKILNQMVNVVNEIIATYGRPDEIRVELARELKKNQKEREALTKAISRSTDERNKDREILIKEFNIPNPTRNDVIRYRLYKELKPNGYHTLYSNKYIEREKLFSKEIDIEHIIPKARLFDDSFSNKTLEYRSVNLDKGNKTAYDYVSETYGEEGLQRYLNTCESLFATQRTKLRKLKMTEREIPDGFIERDLRNTQYIAKKALAMLNQICRRVVATTGAVTDQLRQDWELVGVLKELNWSKYEAVGNVEYHTDHDGRRIGRIKDWTKRNDHRHHAMDALTVAFTRDAFIQYFNHKNASFQADSIEYAIKNAYFKEGRAIPPIPLGELRSEAKKHLNNILVSIKAKNKVATQNINKVKTRSHGTISKVQLTPRGQLHEATIYGSHLEYVTREEKVNASFTEDKIMTVCSQRYKEALLQRLHQFGDDAKKAFTGKNALDKNPIWLGEMHIESVPPKVKTVSQERFFTKRKPIDAKLNVEKVVDPHIRSILRERLEMFDGKADKAFVNLDEQPIWLNREKGICIKKVTIYENLGKPTALHDKADKDGNPIIDKNGKQIPVDYVNTGNNHHVAIYRKPVLDKNGLQKYDDHDQPLYELEERVVSFYEVVERVNQGLPAVDKAYRSDEGWKFLYSMKQNECFVFHNPQTGFDPKEVDLMDPDNYALISSNLFRVQKLSSKYYNFRHHLDTGVEENKTLQDIMWKRITSLKKMDTIVKVRLDHLGRIVQVGEY